MPREVAIIGQGSWYIDDAHRPTAVAALRRGLDLGMTHLDTAEMYGDAELVVGDAIAGRREEVFLVSKVLPNNASRAGVVAACERSLARLRTDRLDCYLLHWPGSHPLEHTFEGFEQLREQGKILSWGVSNFDVPDLEAAWKAGGEGRIAILLEYLGLSPILSLGMRLGEGTGAVLAMPVLESALALLRQMSTFTSAGVSAASEVPAG